MPDLPILTAGQTREVSLDGTRYTVRALTHGQHAALQLALAEFPLPSTDLITDEMHQIALAEGRADLAEALLAEGEAADALRLFNAGAPPETDAEGVVRWRADNAAEIARLRGAVLKAGRAARVARERFAGHPRIAEMTVRISHGQARHSQLLVAAGIVAIDGEPAAITADQVATLPSGHVSLLAVAVSELLTPGVDAAKN